MIAILGGGVVGAATAWALARRGRRDVVVFDPRPRGSGSTGRAFGGFRTQQGNALNIALSLASRPFFEARSDRIGFRSVGYLYLAETDEVAAELRSRAEYQREQGLPIEHPDPLTLVPSLQVSDVVDTNFCALDGVYFPPSVLECFVAEAAEAGAEFRYECPASPHDLEAEVLVLCPGPWAREVGSSLQVELDVIPVERGIFQVGPFDWVSPDVPVTLDAGSGYHFRQRDGRLLIIGPGDPHQWGHHRDWLEWRLPRAALERPERQWTGFYEVTPDHHPLVGLTERPGVWASCGFSGHGVMHSPAVADCLAAMILGDTPPIDISALSPLRDQALVDVTQL
ncbi:FAD-binding oxidoreductase [Candidatus Nephthysia bennettiae]|uniref:FAD-binding oxidoreductase n=1 Tax=Candidatus Nephthysia bennettiae TaxID=3127016 RepID=A0A934K126_9BACT|nr:FAD-binding oxidoreductase [Candidatus Dormibacteraeota bacterium]MBJ7611704.1 FAD-binding oxidoreductase [Candidatus Dormibacteraeota bacterium]